MLIAQKAIKKLFRKCKNTQFRGGENIYPAELEGVLLKHEKIVDVHVVGVPSKRLGEEVIRFNHCSNFV